MADRSLEEFADRIAVLMPVMTREYLKRQTADFYKMKVTLPQLILLDVLSKRGQMKMGDLAEAASVTTAAITGIADRLVRDGYLVRASDPQDRRIVKVKLTTKGANLVKKVEDHKRAITMDMFSMVSQEEREAYVKILEHIYSHIMEKSH